MRSETLFENSLKMLLDPFAAAEKGLRVAAAYREVLDAQSVMLRATADYSEKLRILNEAISADPSEH